MTREKFGKIAHDLMLKDMNTEASQQHSMQEQVDEMLKDFEPGVWTCIKHATGKMSCIEYNQSAMEGKGCNPVTCRPFPGDFFVEVITFKPKLFPNTIKQAFIARNTCPTPNYDQIVFKYDSGLEQPVEIWVIGSRLNCYYFLQNTKTVKPEMWKMVEYIKQFDSGELFRLAKQLNGEQEDSDDLVINKTFTVN